MNFCQTQADLPAAIQVPVVMQPQLDAVFEGDRHPIHNRNPYSVCLVVTAVLAFVAMSTCWLSGTAAFIFSLKVMQPQLDAVFEGDRHPIHNRNPYSVCLVVTAVLAFVAMSTCWLSGTAAFIFSLKVMQPQLDAVFEGDRHPIHNRNPYSVCLVVTAVLAFVAMSTCWLSGTAAFIFSLKSAARTVLFGFVSAVSVTYTFVDNKGSMEAGHMNKWYAAATGLRLALVLFGEWQDRTMAVKFTDVDYYVFSDASKFVTKGQSPYDRATFRYTPLLAWALTPNVFLHPFFGKFVFILFDVLTGHLIFTILKNNNVSEKTAKASSLLWLLNPLPSVVSSRGNAESVMAYLVLQTISLLQKRQISLAAFLYALAVHVKIYPATYAPVLYLFLETQQESALSQKMSKGEVVKRTGTEAVLNFLWSLRPTWNRIKFGAIAGATLAILTAVFYVKYGWVFLYETYLYHIVRKDIRHNFSPYFYMLYLTAGDDSSFLIKFITFCPQLLLLVAIAMRFHADLPLSCFLCTFTFVMLNKVCTSQYFLWYLCLLPLLVPRLHMTWVKTLGVTFLWFIAQGLWLLPAYYLEFEGKNTFLYIWLAGLFFFTVNVYIVFTIISHYSFSQEYSLSLKRE